MGWEAGWVTVAGTLSRGGAEGGVQEEQDGSTREGGSKGLK